MEVLRNEATGQPVGVVGQRPSAASKVIMLVIAIVAAVGWAIIALHRGETINSVWLVAAAVGSYFIAYTLYSRLIAYKVVRPRDDRATPAEQHADGCPPIAACSLGITSLPSRARVRWWGR